MSLAIAPKISLDKYCTTGKAEDQLCNVTNDSQRTDCYESMHAFKKIRTSTSGLRKSPNKWTKEENQKLASLVAHYGEKKWKRISAEMGGQKTGAQCAQHWKRVLSPEIRKGHWDENEEDLLLRLVVQYGSCWKKIAKRIPQRTDIQCRYQYLKAKQSREVKWDGKEDESLIKKVMEITNCTISNNGWSFCANSPATPTTPTPTTSTFTSATPSPPPSVPLSLNHSPTNKENENDNRHMRSSSSSISSSGEITDDRSSLKSSGESSGGSYVWNDSKSDVEMKDCAELRTECGPAGNSDFAINKVVWLEIAEHMARMKLTSTLRTALECKTRFLELLGGIIFSGPSNDTKYAADLKGSGNAENTKGPLYRHTPNDTNININIHNINNNITINNFSNNITININNSATTNTTKSANGSPTSNTDNNTNSPSKPLNSTTSPSKPPSNNSPSKPLNSTQTIPNGTLNGLNGIPVSSPISIPNHTPNSPHTNSPTTSSNSPLKFPNTPSIPNISTNFPHSSLNTFLKTEATSTPEMSHSPLLPILRFPQISQQISQISQPFLLSKQTRNVPNGLESLAAVAAILPREMLAENAQF